MSYVTTVGVNARKKVYLLYFISEAKQWARLLLSQPNRELDNHWEESDQPVQFPTQCANAALVEEGVELTGKVHLDIHKGSGIL